MNCREIVNGSSAETHKFFPIHYGLLREFSKSISTYNTKCNKINTCHFVVQKHVFCKNDLNIVYFLYAGSHKSQYITVYGGGNITELACFIEM